MTALSFDHSGRGGEPVLAGALALTEACRAQPDASRLAHVRVRAGSNRRRRRAQ
jgi:hypothetical protein